MGRTRKIIFAACLFASIAVITYLHHMTGIDEQPLHSIYNELHYIPLLAAALLFGVQGALLSSLLISLFYVTYLLFNWSGTLIFLMDNFVHLVFPGLVALVLGFYVDREKRDLQRREKERYLSALGQAAAAVVHDLKNPIFVILASLSLIRGGKGDLDKSLRMAEGGAKKLEKIVQEILDFSKPSGVNRLKQDLVKIVSAASDSCSDKAKEAGIRVVVDISPEPVLLSLDGLQIERVIVNLLSNAIEASDQGQTISVNLRKEGKSAIISVSDQGNGMDKETVDNLFIPFYSKKIKGTGLGMAIVKKIIEEHGGLVGVASQPGVGTTVSLYLPLKIHGA